MLPFECGPRDKLSIELSGSLRHTRCSGGRGESALMSISLMRPKGRVWRYELHGGCQLCCLSRRWLDARAERGASQIGRHIATRRRASCFATGRHAMLRSWLRSTRRAASCNQFIFSAAIWIGTISPASSRISRGAGFTYGDSSLVDPTYPGYPALDGVPQIDSQPRGCYSRDYIVPSEDYGGSQTVTVTRCYGM